MCADFRLEGNDFRIFIEESARRGMEVYIPAIVIDEVVNQYGEQIRELCSKFSKLAPAWKRVRGDDLPSPIAEDQIGREQEAYRTFLLTKLKSFGVTILPYPNTSHERLVTRALQRRKPFRNDGAGYRDTLVWESVLPLLKGTDSMLCFRHPQQQGLRRRTRGSR
jgi:hypothetical protein